MKAFTIVSSLICVLLVAAIGFAQESEVTTTTSVSLTPVTSTAKADTASTTTVLLTDKARLVPKMDGIPVAQNEPKQSCVP